MGIVEKVVYGKNSFPRALQWAKKEWIKKWQRLGGGRFNRRLYNGVRMRRFIRVGI